MTMYLKNKDLIKDLQRRVVKLDKQVSEVVLKSQLEAMENKVDQIASNLKNLHTKIDKEYCTIDLMSSSISDLDDKVQKDFVPKPLFQFNHDKLKSELSTAQNKHKALHEFVSNFRNDFDKFNEEVVTKTDAEFLQDQINH